MSIGTANQYFVGVRNKLDVEQVLGRFALDGDHGLFLGCHVVDPQLEADKPVKVLPSFLPKLQ